MSSICPACAFESAVLTRPVISTRLRVKGEPMTATLRVDRTGQIMMWSHEAEKSLGYSASEAVGQSIEIIIPHHLGERIARVLRVCADWD